MSLSRFSPIPAIQKTTGKISPRLPRFEDRYAPGLLPLLAKQTRVEPPGDKSESDGSSESEKPTGTLEVDNRIILPPFAVGKLASSNRCMERS